jgi:hypothetical protein
MEASWTQLSAVDENARAALSKVTRPTELLTSIADYISGRQT